VIRQYAVNILYIDVSSLTSGKSPSLDPQVPYTDEMAVMRDLHRKNAAEIHFSVYGMCLILGRFSAFAALARDCCTDAAGEKIVDCWMAPRRILMR
jgi:hypothetical protein